MKSIILLICAFPLLLQAQKPLTENQKIDHLISYIRNLRDVVFIRNGSEHTAKEAADHLQKKRKDAGSKIKTAEEFISKIASRSSYSGKPYLIRLKSGKELTCEEMLRAELAKLK